MLPDTIIKVGGSLLETPGLGARLRAWLAGEPFARPALLAGGGALADGIRRLDAVHHFDEEAAHWLAIGGMALNARVLAALLAEGRVAGSSQEVNEALEQGCLPILDAMSFLRADEGSPAALPHSWDVTSDSIAARLAVLLGARTLVLLKACPIPPGASWQELADAGIVDRWFPRVAGEVGRVRAVCLR
jgi:aspartokinase-like uncharacterized kinase